MYITMGERKGRGSGWIRLFVGNRGSGQRFTGSGPRKVTRGHKAIWSHHNSSALATVPLMYDLENLYDDVQVFEGFI